MALIVIHGDERIEIASSDHKVSPYRPFYKVAFRSQGRDTRLDDPRVVIAKQAAFAGMGVDAEYTEFGIVDSDLPQRARASAHRRLDEARIDARQRILQPLVQGYMHDAQTAADEHKKDLVFR